MKKQCLAICIAMILAIPLTFSQVEQKYGNTNDKNLPDWASEMYKEKPDYGKVINLYDAWRIDNQAVKNSHTQYYKRLLHDLRQDPYGVRFGFTTTAEAEQMDREYLQRIEKAKQTNSGKGTWTCVGPFDFDQEANSRSYAPGAAHMYCVEQSLSNTDVLYAGGATSGLWKTTDKGNNWSLLTRDFTFNTVYALEIDFSDENIIYFGGNSGMYKSTDGGSTISQIGDVTFQAASHNHFRDIKMHPANSSTLWAASDAGLWKTTDAGSNWSQIMSGEFQEIEFKPDNSSVMYVIRMVADTTEFHKSIDGGLNWVKKTNGWPAPSTQTQPAENKRAEIAVSPADPDRIYAQACGVANGGSGLYGLYVSYDAGETWTFNCCGPQPAGVPDASTNPNLMGWDDQGGDNGGQYYFDVALAVSSTNADSVILSGVNTWYSADAGATFNCPAKWSHPDKPNYVHADMHDINIYGQDIWMACDGGIFYSNNGNQNITRKMYGISGTDFWGFDAGFSNSDVMLGGTYHNGTHLKDGNTYINGWLCTQGGDNWRGTVNPYNDRIVYHDGGRKLLPGDRTEDITGLDYTISYNTGSNLEFDRNNSDVIYSGRNNELRKSEDGGATYTVLYDFGESVGRVKIAPSNPDIIVVTTNTGIYDTKDIFRSVDGGTTWTNITPTSTVLNGTTEINYDFEIHESDPDIIYLARIPKYSWSSWLKDGYKVFKTTDAGNTWTNITTSDLDGEWIVNIAYQQGTDGGLYLGTRRAVYYKNNTMTNWVLYNTGMPAGTYSQNLVLDYYNGKIINGTNHSVYINDFYESSDVIADFVTDKNSVFCARDTVYFTDHSIVVQAGATWAWSFPGASYVSSASSKNPKVVYGAAGTYSVSLTVTDAGSNSDTKVKTDFVTIAPECDPETVPGNALNNPGGSSDRVIGPPLNITTNNITFSAWIKRDGDQNDFTAIIFSRGGSVGAGGLNFGYDNELRHHWNSGNWGWNSGLVVPNGIWTHVALVIEPTHATIYMNGEPAVHNSTKDAKNFDVNLYVGGDPGYSNRNFNGLIDEVCVYNTALTQEQIRDLMYKTVDPSSISSLIRYYQFNRASGTITDRVGLAHADMSGNSTRTNSTAPIPYNTIADGNWSSDATWDTDQNAPVKDWARVKIENDVTLDQNQTLKSLDITSTGSLTVNASQQLTMDGTELVNGSGTDGLILKADATGIASLLHNTNNVDATVESYITEDKWHIISTPISNAQSSVFTDLYLMYFDETDYSWHYITPLDYDLTEGRGFMAWSASGSNGNATVSYEGNLNNGDILVTGLSYTASQPMAERGWNLVGNPYPSAIHWNSAWDRTNLDATIYVYDAGTSGNYLTYNTSGIGTHPTGDIAPGQGFWVKASDAGASLTIPQSERKHSNQAFYKDGEQMNLLSLNIEGNGYADKMIVQFNDEATAGFDTEFDAWKFEGDEAAPQLYSVYGNNELAVNILPFEGENMIIPLNFKAGVETLYTISVADLANFDEAVGVYLEDLKESNMIDLRQVADYSFNASPIDEPERFLLHFSNTAFGIEGHATNDFQIYSYDKDVYIKVPVSTTGDIKVYNMMGQEIVYASVNNTINKITIEKNGYYVVTVISRETFVTEKVFIH